ncbi:triosephosphate isomerase [Candidatus Curtissbacteria bacterium]|nr:triosephosphate isomerase [Candidatus Curtissbacteria bacterium]
MNDATPLVVANLKANKTWDEMSDWLDQISPFAEKFSGTVVVCPTSAFIAAAHQKLQTENSKLKLGSQDISKFEHGAYTGELAASQIADICQYAIIGHSERKKFFGETPDDVLAKLKLALDAKVKPILCLANIEELDYYLSKSPFLQEASSQICFVYEPPSAISAQGEYKPDDPEVAAKIAGSIKSKISPEAVVIYGGSINSNNAAGFFSKESIKGGLVGQASLDPSHFVRILESISR